MELRDHFPLLATRAYLNAGTCGPLPSSAVQAQRSANDAELIEGRAGAHFEATLALRDRQRAAYARVLGVAEDDVALTSSTSEGCARALAALDPAPGSVILTSDEEHPGLQGPLIAWRERGVELRVVPFAELTEHVDDEVGIVATSHVSWASGRMVGPELGRAVSAAGGLLVLDGAQGAGAVPADPVALGCAFYAGSGQKWLCGPDGTGMLYVAPEVSAARTPLDPSYLSLERPNEGLDSPLKAGAAAFDGPKLSRSQSAAAVAALEVLEQAGLDAGFSRTAALAAQLADGLERGGREVIARDATTLVSWRDDDPEAAKQRLAGEGIVVRDLPGRGTLRASVGAWNDEGDIDRLLAAL